MFVCLKKYNFFIIPFLKIKMSIEIIYLIRVELLGHIKVLGGPHVTRGPDVSQA
jgi:hypothetical protein